MSKFYVGATFTRFREVRALIDCLIEMGHEPLADWTRDRENFDEAGNPLVHVNGGYEKADYWPILAERELAACEAVARTGGFAVFLGQEPSIGWPTEFGATLQTIRIFSGSGNDGDEIRYYQAEGARIYLVAPFKTVIFSTTPWVVECETVEEAIEHIDGAPEDDVTYVDVDAA